MKIELPILNSKDCELKAWCIQHFKVNPKKKKTKYDEQPYIILNCTKSSCEIKQSTMSTNGRTIYEAYFNIPRGIAVIRKILCVVEKG